MMEASGQNNKRKYFLIGLGLITTGIAGIFGWRYFRKENNNQIDDMEFSENESLPVKSGISSQRNDNFPLKKGSKGERVKLLQQALINKYGASLFPKYGADGVFGSELQKGLQSKGLPVIIDESTYNVMVKSEEMDFGTIARQLFQSATTKNLKAAIDSLRKLKSVEDYQKASTAFQNYRINGVRNTLVNGLLKSFPIEANKQSLRMEFLRMGLKYDGTKWSLSGIEGMRRLITKQSCPIYKGKTDMVFTQVRSNTVLGYKEFNKNEWIYFSPIGSCELFRVKKEYVKN